MKIVITGDLLRPNLDGSAMQPPNIIRLYNEVRKSGLDLTLLNVPNPLPFEDWLKTDSETDFPCWHLTQQYVPIDKDTIVIGFELPVNALLQFAANGIPCLDIRDYPIRCLEQKYYGIISAEEFPIQVVRESGFTSGDYYRNLYRQMGRMWIDFKKSPPYKAARNDDFGLIIGQTPNDRSIVQRGKLLKLEDFKEEILEAKASHSKLLFRSHPHGNHHGDELMLSLGIECVKTPTYQLLASPGCQHVYGISSSVLYESYHFGREATFWARRNDIDLYAPIPRELLSDPEFWKNILPTLREPSE